MPKHCLLLLSGLLILLFTNVNAQNQQTIFNKYLTGYLSYDRVYFHTEKRYFVASQATDSLNLQVNDVNEVKQIIDGDLKNKVYSIEILNAKRPDLAGIFRLLSSFPNLTFLKISDPFFTSEKDLPYDLPDNIKLLQQLKGIEFFYNEKMNMKDAIDKIASLTKLNAISFSGYHHPLPPAVTRLAVSYIKLESVNLEDLDISNVKWQSVVLNGSAPKPAHDAAILAKLSAVTSLRYLQLGFYMLGDGSALTRLKQLNTLSLGSCYVDSAVQIFQKIRGLKDLTTLFVLPGNDSTQVINGIEDLTALKSLNLSYLKSLSKHPEQLNALHNLRNLESLKIASGNISILPDIFSKLTKLKSVNIEGNTLTELPQSLWNLPQLEYLNASGNKLQLLPIKFDLKSLKVLHLEYNNLTAFPPAVTGLTRLQNLDVSSNKIKTLPPGWQKLTGLKQVNFKGNFLAAYPEGLQKLAGLELIDLSENDLSVMPDIETNSYALKSLKLANNNLTALPANLGLYTKLEILDVSGNLLTGLPESLGMCQQLQQLDAHSASYKFRFDADKKGDARFNTVRSDSTHVNNIKMLPPGLASAGHLQLLQLSGNAAIDQTSVFNVLLGTPRKSFRVDLSYDNLKQLPADERWANMTFYELNLSHNKITTLPPQFANISVDFQLIINNNLLKVPRNSLDNTIQNKGDMKILFDELGIALPNFNISSKEYALALCSRANALGYSENWAKVVEFSNRALVIDSAVYAHNIRWDNIGTARFKMKDYRGAIKDFDRYLFNELKASIRVLNFIEPVIQYKAESHLMLGQTTEAAKTYEYDYRNYGGAGSGSLQHAAILYKAAGNLQQYRKLLDTALASAQKTVDANKRSDHPSIDNVLDYAELLVIAGKPADVSSLLNQEYYRPTPSSISVKNYLLATANYLTGSQSFDAAKKALNQAIAVNGKVTNWDFSMFNTWVANSGFSKAKQQQLLDLEDITK